MHRWLHIVPAVIFSAATAAAVQSGAPGQPHRADLTYDGRFTLVAGHSTSRGGGYVQLTRDFLNAPERYLKRLLASDNEG